MHADLRLKIRRVCNAAAIIELCAQSALPGRPESQHSAIGCSFVLVLLGYAPRGCTVPVPRTARQLGRRARWNVAGATQERGRDGCGGALCGHQWHSRTCGVGPWPWLGPGSLTRALPARRHRPASPAHSDPPLARTPSAWRGEDGIESDPPSRHGGPPEGVRQESTFGWNRPEERTEEILCTRPYPSLGLWCTSIPHHRAEPGASAVESTVLFGFGPLPLPPCRPPPAPLP